MTIPTSQPRVRADAQGLARFLENLGVDLAQLQPGPDGRHTADSLTAEITARARAASFPVSSAAANRPRDSAAPGRIPLSPSQLRDPKRLAASIARDRQASPAAQPPTPTAGAAPRAQARKVQPMPADVSATDATVNATRHARRPTLATAGPYDGSNGLPAFTASGLDPKVLLNYPAALRPVLASAPTIDQAYSIGNRYAGMSNAQIMEALPQDPSVPGHLAYACRPPGYVEEQPADRLKNGTPGPAGPPPADTDDYWFPGLR
jgi:hypothetical protein